MKLLAKNYQNPTGNGGTYPLAVIQDIGTSLSRFTNSYSITFSLEVESNGKMIELDTTTMVFRGMEIEISKGKTTNQESLVSVPNPLYEVNYELNGNETSEEIVNKTTPYFIKNMMEHLIENNGQLGNAQVVEYGYPTFEKAKQFFEGGDLENPELSITNPIAIGFLLSKLIINGEPAGIQFQLEI